MSILIALVVAAVCLLVGGSVMSRIHGPASSLDFPSNDAYFAFLEKRDRFFMDEHLGVAALAAALSTMAAGWYESGPVLPGLVFAIVTFAVWCLLRLWIGRKEEARMMWDRVDKIRLLASLVAGFAAASVVAAGLGVAATSAVFPAGVVLLVVWVLMFPM